MNENPQVIVDIKEDFEELFYLYDANLTQLLQFREDLKSGKKYFIKETFFEIENFIFSLISKNDRNIKEINSILAKLNLNHKSFSFENLRQKRNIFRDYIRVLKAETASLIVSSDWQSPSYNFSMYSNAGRQTGKIWGTVNDYKRDIHLDETDFENEYLREYIDAKLKFLLKCFLTNSGQSAFITILTYLLSTGKLRNKIILGSNSYFQYKQILAQTLGNKIIQVNEDNTSRILNLIKKKQPSAIFLDTITNSRNIHLPNLNEIISNIYAHYTQELYIVIDNTCCPLFNQPFLVRKRNPNIHMVMFESLNKYHQFGTDRVTGGIITAEKKDWYGISEYRKHSGTNIPDYSVHALTKPKRFFLNKRILRHGRNTLELARYLYSLSLSKQKVIENIVCPGLANHPSYDWNHDSRFYGSFISIHFKKKFENKGKINKFIDCAIKTAKKEKVNLIAGTSFGLNATRIYLTSLWSKYGNPFLRVSVGTEDSLELEKLKSVFRRTIDKFDRNNFLGL